MPSSPEALNNRAMDLCLIGFQTRLLSVRWEKAAMKSLGFSSVKSFPHDVEGRVTIPIAARWLIDNDSGII